MPSSIGNFSFANPPHKDAEPPKGGSIPNDVHIRCEAGATIRLHGAGLKGHDMVGPTDPKATYNVEGHDTTTIDITNIEVKDGETFNVRIETQDKTGKLPVLQFSWTKFRRQIEWSVDKHRIVEFPVSANLPKDE